MGVDTCEQYMIKRSEYDIYHRSHQAACCQICRYHIQVFQWCNPHNQWRRSHSQSTGSKCACNEYGEFYNDMSRLPLFSFFDNFPIDTYLK